MSVLKVSFVAIGSELLSGQVVDRNSAFLAKEMNAMGFRTQRINIVDDILPDMVETITEAVSLSDLVFTTGGLGPTSDDVTRQAVANTAGVELEKSSESVKRLEKYATKRGRVLNSNSLLQAYFPKGSEILVNDVGTADAFLTNVSHDGRSVPVISLPGPPKELHHVFENEVKPRLLKRFEVSLSPSQCLRCFGLSESYVGTMIDQLRLPEGISVAYRPTFPELLLTLSLEPAFAEEADGEQRMATAREEIEKALGTEFIFAQQSPTQMSQVVADMLQQRKLRLSVAESCTGGMLADKLVSTPGASNFFLGSMVTYSNSAKEVFLGVKPSLLESKGAVSEEVAESMARAAKARIGADIAVSITGIAGPDGGSVEKPVGTVWIGLAFENEVQAFRYHLPFDRNAFRVYSSTLALDLIRRKLNNYPLTWETR